MDGGNSFAVAEPDAAAVSVVGVEGLFEGEVGFKEAP